MNTEDQPRRWPSLLTVAQTADLLGRNDQTIRTMIRAGSLRARLMPGGSYVLRRDHVLIDAERHADVVAQAYRTRRRART